MIIRSAFAARFTGVRIESIWIVTIAVTSAAASACTHSGWRISWTKSSSTATAASSNCDTTSARGSSRISQSLKSVVPIIYIKTNISSWTAITFRVKILKILIKFNHINGFKDWIYQTLAQRHVYMHYSRFHCRRKCLDLPKMSLNLVFNSVSKR